MKFFYYIQQCRQTSKVSNQTFAFQHRIMPKGQYPDRLISQHSLNATCNNVCNKQKINLINFFSSQLEELFSFFY